MGLFDYFKKKKQLKQKKEYEDRMEEKETIDCMIVGSQTNTQWSKDTDGKIIEISNKKMGEIERPIPIYEIYQGL